jgi:hypothetical protein
MFPENGQEEYNAFKAWYTEGSSLLQRMHSGSDQTDFEIPDYWHKCKEFINNNDIRILPEDVDMINYLMSDG